MCIGTPTDKDMDIDQIQICYRCRYRCGYRNRYGQRYRHVNGSLQGLQPGQQDLEKIRSWAVSPLPHDPPERACGGFYSFRGSIFVNALIMRALLLGAYNRAPDFLKLHV